MSDTQQKSTSHFLNLFSLALADSKIDLAEMELLYKIGLENGVTKEEIEYIIDNPHKARFTKPENINSALEQFYDLCRMILADGKIDVREIVFVKSACSKFEIKEDKIDSILEYVIDAIKSGEDRAKTIAQVTNQL